MCFKRRIEIKSLKQTKIMKKIIKGVWLSPYLPKISLKMKLTTLFLILSLVRIQASTYSQNTKLTLNVNNTSVEQLFNKIESVSEYRFLFESSLIDLDRKVSLNVEKKKITEILEKVFKGTDIAYTINDRQILLIKKKEQAFPLVTNTVVKTVVEQDNKITGVVKDAQGMPIPGVNVQEKGTKNGIQTDFDGKFSMRLSDTNAVLQLTFVGFKNKEVKVGGRSSITIVLEENLESLDEVKVVSFGYGTIKKENLLGSVASIGAKELSKIPVTNVAEAMAGRLAGVSVQSVDGAPGSDIMIRVRGGGSITQDNSPLYVVDGFIVSNINDIPPGDILSIDILKDAATTAIYGAQGANGVVIITTKKPKAGKTTVTFNHYTQFLQLPTDRKMDVLSPYEYVTMQYETARMKSDADVRNFEKFYGKFDDLELYKYKKANDWQEEVLGKSTISYYNNISISGGTETTKLSLSYTNNNDEGLMVGSGLKRDVINFKINHEITKKLKLDASARITNLEVDGAGTSGGAQVRVKNLITSRPTNGIADELEFDIADVDNLDDYQSFVLSLIDPVELAKQDWRKRTTKSYVINAGLTWDILDNLTAKSVFTSSKTYGENLRFFGPLTGTSQQEGNSLPLGTKDDSEGLSYRVSNTLNYDFKNIGDHQLGILVGQEVLSRGGKAQSVRVENFRASITPEEMFAAMALGTVVEHKTENYTDENWFSFFGRANYSYKDKYLFTATIRRDASSKFSGENNIGIFPAFAAGWKISSEPFLKDSKIVNELKLRVSYGETGNDRIPANSTRFLFQAETNNGPGFGTNAYNVYYGIAGSTLFNPDLIWETTINRNLGLDFRFFNSAINGSFDLYKNTTEDLLLQSAISQTSGFSTQWANIGSTQNQGVELALNAGLINKKDFSLNLNLNFGINKTKILELDGTNSRFFQSNWASTDLKDRDDYYLEVGRSIGLIYGYVNDGMYTVDDFNSYNETSRSYVLKDGVVDNKGILGVANVKPGYMKLKDLNGDGKIDTNDRKVIGNALPKAQGGFGLTGTLKGFDFTAFFNWSVGNDVYNTGKIDYNQLYRSNYGNMLNTMNSANRFTYIDMDGSYTGVAGGIVTDLAQLADMNQNKTIWSGNNSFGGATAVVSDWAIEDGSYLRLNNVTVGYSVPSESIKKVGMSSLRFFVTGTNLALWTKYSGFDPDVNSSRNSTTAALAPGLDYSSYPKSRTFTFGVNVNF